MGLSIACRGCAVHNSFSFCAVAVTTVAKVPRTTRSGERHCAHVTLEDLLAMSTSA